jgi:hypothetical protein
MPQGDSGPREFELETEKPSKESKNPKSPDPSKTPIAPKPESGDPGPR